MRTSRTILAALLLGGALALASPPPARAAVSVSVSIFYDRLAPYGRWVVAGSYGRCWVPPGVVAGWEPYVDGEWVWTDYGWTWVSFDPWSDVVYHYGTWVWVDPYGWVWVPGTIWAPAWVTWAYTDDYIGWAPVPPSFVLAAGGYSGGPLVVPATRYVFVPSNQFVGVKVSTVRVPSREASTVFARATKVTRYTVSGGIVHTAGPAPERIERAAGRRIARVGIDRIRAKPTTLAAAGVSRSRSIAVVAPPKVRDRTFSSRSIAGGARPSRPPAEHARAAGRPPESGQVAGHAPARSAAPPERGRTDRREIGKTRVERHASSPAPATSERIAPRGRSEGGPASHGHTASVAPREEHRPEPPPAHAAAPGPAGPPPGHAAKPPQNPGKGRDKKDSPGG